jgi:hypothetical protein
VEFIGAILGNMVSLVVIGMVIAVGYKVFQMGGDLREIKDLLEKISRRADASPLSSTPSNIHSGLNNQSPEELIRAIHAAGIPELDAESSPTNSHPLVNSSEG